MRRVVDSVFLVALGALTGLLLAEVSAMEGWLREYQALITGILAVGAALYTVRQMQLSDERQEKRHRELIDFSMQPDRRRVAKAVQNAEPFRKIATLMDRLIRDDGQDGFVSRVLNEPSYEDRKLFDSTVHFCDQIAKAQNIPAAIELFEPRMSTCWLRLVGNASDIEKQRALMLGPVKSVPNAVRTRKALENLTKYVREMADHLDRLAIKYGLDHAARPTA